MHNNNDAQICHPVSPINSAGYVNTDCGSRVGKEESTSQQKSPIALGSNLDKTDRLEFGMYVYLHSSRFGEQHLLCRYTIGDMPPQTRTFGNITSS